MGKWGSVGAAATGGVAVLALQAVLVYGIGLQIVLPESQMAPLSTALAKKFRADWPHMRHRIKKAITPLMHEEVNRLVSDIRITVGGTPIALPLSLKAQLAQDINRLLTANLEQYWGARWDPARVITPTLIEKAWAHPMVVHFWVRVDRVPVPCTLTLGGRSA